jgi:hypothetical protein
MQVEVLARLACCTASTVPWAACGTGSLVAHPSMLHYVRWDQRASKLLLVKLNNAALHPPVVLKACGCTSTCGTWGPHSVERQASSATVPSQACLLASIPVCTQPVVVSNDSEHRHCQQPCTPHSCERLSASTELLSAIV